MKNKIIIIVLFVIAMILTIFVPNLSGSNIKKSKLYISEISASNYSVIQDDDGAYSDYIEIYNGYSRTINLEDYYLSDSEYNTDKWRFPSIEIKPKEYLIVYASGKDKCNLESRVCHTNFKLSDKGEVISLSDLNGNIISKVSFGEQLSDISYGYVKGKYTYIEPSPNKSNVKKDINTGGNYGIRINEYITSNKGNDYTKDGNSYDWVELYNYSKKDINLKYIYISDNINKITKYELPDKILKPDEYVVIYLSGNDCYKNDEIHANFRLSSKDEKLIISNGKKIIDSVNIVELSDNISYGYKDKKWYYFTTPTKGRSNSTAAFESIGE